MKHMIYTLYTCLFLLATSTLNAQYWVNGNIDSPFDELHDIISTSDGGYIAAGGAAQGGEELSSIIKYDFEGKEEWETFLPIFVATQGSFYVNVALAVVETDDAFIVAEYANVIGFPSRFSLTEISLDGELIQRNEIDGYSISGLVKNDMGELYAIVNEYLSPEPNIIKYSKELEELWQITLSEGAATGFDTHAYLDKNGYIQHWSFSSQEDDMVIHHEIDSEGNILRADLYPEFHDDDQADDFLFVRGVLHGALANDKVAFLADGGDYNDNLFRELAIADTNSKEVINKVDISDSFFWITDLHTTDNRIYVSGNVQSGDTVWTRFLVFDEVLNQIDEINLNELIKEAEPGAFGAVVYEFKLDDNENMLGAGTMYFTNNGGIGSYGYFSFYLNKEGTLEVLSSSKELVTPLVKIYPNPCTEHIFVEQPGESNWDNIILYSSDGSLIRNYNKVQFPIKVETNHLPDGPYSIVLTNKSKSIVLPFIKN